VRRGDEVKKENGREIRKGGGGTRRERRGGVIWGGERETGGNRGVEVDAKEWSERLREEALIKIGIREEGVGRSE